MTATNRDELTDFVDPDAPPSPPKPDPGQYVLRWPWYYPTLIGGCGLLFAALYAASSGVAGLLLFALGGSLGGLVLTLMAMAWAVAIVFADDVRSGLWFVLFPPYMPVYAVRRWKWMAQPTAMFLCGLALIAASLWMTQRLAKSVAAPLVSLSDTDVRGSRGPPTGHERYARFARGTDSHLRTCQDDWSREPCMTASTSTRSAVTM
jgi:hypothetical protein